MELMRALQAIAQEPMTTTPVKLARRLQVGKHEVKGAIRDLKHHGWVEDVGGKLLLTEAGEEQVAQRAYVPKFFRTASEGPPLRPTALRVWKQIKRSPGLQPKDIAEALDMTSGAVRQAVHALKKAGQVEKREDGLHVTVRSRNQRLREVRDRVASVLADLDALLAD